MSLYHTTKRVVHCLAQCDNCIWSDDDQYQAARRAALHARTTGHTVRVEHGTTYKVGRQGSKA